MGEVKECIGYKGTLYHNLGELEDNAMGILITTNRKPVFIQSSWTEWEGYLYIEVHGTKGTIYVDNRAEKAITILKSRDLKEKKIYDFSKEPRKSFRLEINEFVSSLLMNKVPSPTGYDGMRVMKIIQGLYTSARTGHIIKVYEEEDNEFLLKFVEAYGQSI